MQLDLGEQRLEIGLVRGAGHHRHLLAFELLRQRIVDRGIAARHEAAGGAVVGIGEVDLGAHLGRDRDRGDDAVAAVLVERRQQGLEAAHLDGAGELELLAHHAGEIDVEALRIAVRPGEIERRIVDLGQEADHHHPAEIGPLRPPPRVPEARHLHGRLGPDRLRERPCRPKAAPGRAGSAGCQERKSHRRPAGRPEARRHGAPDRTGRASSLCIGKSPASERSVHPTAYKRVAAAFAGTCKLAQNLVHNVFHRLARSVGHVIILTNEDIEPLLNMPDCIVAIEQAFRDFGDGRAVDIPRQDAIVPCPLRGGGGAIHDLKTMSGSWPAAGIAALRLNSDIVHWPVINNSTRRVKLAISEPGGRYNGAVLLVLDRDRPAALHAQRRHHAEVPRRRLERGRRQAPGAARARARSACSAPGCRPAASSRPCASCAGSRKSRSTAPTPENRQAFADHFRERLQINIRPVASAEEAADGVDVLVTATNSLKPTIAPEWVKPGMHISSIRSGELPLEVLGKVDRLVVNARGGGESFVARDCPRCAGGQRRAAYRISRACRSSRTWRPARRPAGRARDEITCFHNYQGLGLQFAALGSIVYREAVKRRIGLVIDDRYFTQSVHP